MKKAFILSVVLTISFAYAHAQTGDPWIKKAYNYFWNRDPTTIEYNINNYNGGHWNNYDELQTYVAQYQKRMRESGIVTRESAQTFNGNKIVTWEQNGTPIAVDLVSLNNGAIVAQGGGNIVAQGGGNIVAQGGGNIVAQGGGNIVAQGGGNLQLSSGLKGASFGSSYTLASSGVTVIKTSGSGALIIR